METMIKALDLRRRFGKKEAVAGSSFRVQQGQICGLLGSNATGKTTTIRLLTSQIDPDGERAPIAGCDGVKDRRRLKSLIGVVFEE